MEHSSFEKAKNESRSFTSSLSSPYFALTCHLALYTSRWLWMPAPGPLVCPAQSGVQSIKGHWSLNTRAACVCGPALCMQHGPEL